MSISLIQCCSTTRWLNRTRSCSRAARSTGRRPRTPSQGGVDLGLLHHAAGERGVQRGQARARSLKTSTSWPPVPKRRTGPNWGSRLLPMMIS